MRRDARPGPDEHYSGHDPETGCGLVVTVAGFVLLVALVVLGIYIGAHL